MKLTRTLFFSFVFGVYYPLITEKEDFKMLADSALEPLSPFSSTNTCFVHLSVPVFSD